MSAPLRLIALLLLVALSSARLDAVETDQTAEGGTPGEAMQTAPPRGVSLPPEPAALAQALDAELRVLTAEDKAFPVYVNARRSDIDRGNIVLLPGDGQLPTLAPGIEELRRSLPRFGWTTWLVALQPPPLVNELRIGTQEPVEQASIKTSAQEETAATAAQPETAASAAGSATSGNEETDSGSLAMQQSRRLEDWANDNMVRIAAAVKAAGEKPVVVAEATASVLLRFYLGGESSALLQAAVFIEPVDPPGIKGVWPEGLSTPVMELLTPTARAERGLELREQASMRRLRSYRQGLVDLRTASGSGGATESALSREVRGWLLSLQ